MKFYQASLLYDELMRQWLLVSVSEQGNPLRTRVDDFTRQSGCKVMRMSVAPEDSMRCWEYVNPRELHARYIKHVAQESERIGWIFKTHSSLPMRKVVDTVIARSDWNEIPQ